MNRNLRKAVLAALSTAALAGISTQASATGVATYTAVGNASGQTFTGSQVYVWDGGNIGYGNAGADDCTTNSCGNLPAPGRPRVGGANAMSGSIQDDRNMGWNHNMVWRTFEITSAGGYTISMTRTSTNTGYQPAFSVWASGSGEYLNENGSHKFNQVVAPTSLVPDVLNGSGAHNDNGNDYMLPDDDGGNDAAWITDFVGYANSGPGFTNGNGNTVVGALGFGTSTEGTLVGANYTSVVTKGAYTNAHAGLITAPYAGVGSSVNTSDPTLANGSGGGYVDMQVWLPAGWYVFAGGGSCADFTCTPTAGFLGSYNLKILSNSSVTAPVPVPAAVWLFGSALAGMGVIGRRKDKPAA